MHNNLDAHSCLVFGPSLSGHLPDDEASVMFLFVYISATMPGLLILGPTLPVPDKVPNSKLTVILSLHQYPLKTWNRTKGERKMRRKACCSAYQCFC